MQNTGQLTARTEFAAAINQICSERGIEPEVVIESIKTAILAAFRKDNPELFEAIALVDGVESQADGQVEETSERYRVDLDEATGAARIIEIETNTDITPPGFGRIAAQTAKQVILQRVREAEKDAIIEEYEDRVGTVISAMVLRFDGRNVILDIGRGQGFMPPEEQIAGEYYKMNQRLSVFIKEIRETLKGQTIIVSRSAPELVEELFSREVPEVASKAVVVRAIAREAGYRTKMAVDSEQDGVDPVGSCVGQKGVRVQEVINELAGEKIDIIQYNSDIKLFIAAALAPAEGMSITVDQENLIATVMVPNDQLSLAIGRGGQNVRLAAKLTGYKIDIKGEEGQEMASADASPVSEFDETELSDRTKNALTQAGILTVAQLRESLAQGELIKGVGPKLREEIDNYLKTAA